VPDSAKEKSVEAEVVAVPALPYINELGTVIPCPVAPGMRVLVGKYAGDYKFRNEDITVVRWDEILAIIQEDSKEAGLPSADDLDAATARAADECYAAEQTSGKQTGLASLASLDLTAADLVKGLQ
jgi:co-chaperonin GroES (HSP10)